MRNNATEGPRSSGNGGAYAPMHLPESGTLPVTMSTISPELIDKLGGAQSSSNVLSITGILNAHAEGTPGRGAGACVYATAFITHHLHHVVDIRQEVAAVQGTYRGQAHWWATVNGVIVDPTRCQFDDGPIVSQDAGYEASTVYPPGWDTRALVIQETVRSYGVPSEGIRVANELFAQIQDRGSQPIPLHSSGYTQVYPGEPMPSPAPLCPPELVGKR